MKTALPQIPNAARPSRSVTLAQLGAGESARVVSVELADVGCKKRFAELGVGPGVKITVGSAGDTMLIHVGSARMAIGAACARNISVLRV